MGTRSHLDLTVNGGRNFDWDTFRAKETVDFRLGRVLRLLTPQMEGGISIVTRAHREEREDFW